MKKIKIYLLKLLNPISPIITLIVGWLLTILITQPNENFPWIINYMIENPVVLLIILSMWIFLSFIYTVLIDQINDLNRELNNKDRIIKEKSKIIKEKDIQLNHTAGIILNKSGDFANFNRLLRFNDVLKGFTENNAIVECTQMYRYTIKRVENSMVIRVLYDCSYCSEGIDINNLEQCYYDINYNDYHKLKEIISTWKKLMNEHMTYSETHSLESTLTKDIKELSEDCHKKLKDISSILDINSLNFTQYRILTLLIRLASKQNTTMLDKNGIIGNSKSEIENYLLNGKRTGILNSILLEDIFMFKYTRNSHKKDGRAYVAFPISISMQNYICVFSIQLMDLDKTIDLEHEIKSLRQNIIERFKKSNVHSTSFVL